MNTLCVIRVIAGAADVTEKQSAKIYLFVVLFVSTLLLQYRLQTQELSSDKVICLSDSTQCTFS